ncbi:MAG: hypothetical protein B7Z53_05645 [Rhodospirillales bacterium 12-71-4]|nr:MAG: hypothetical protein B7Z53_05645 [Rhodospirillales bacterium 12-71-4]
MARTEDQAGGLIVPVILCGGTGSRLWPLSREGYPKQFWPLVSQGTMLQETADRARGAGFAPPVIVCGEAHRFLVAEQLREAGIRDPRIVLEPEARNSAAAIAAAAVLVGEETPGAVLWIMAADAAVQDVPALRRALEAAAAAAATGRICTFGIRPTVAETGYGYIEAGPALDGVAGALQIARFVEKPDAGNSGMFVATAATLVAELANHAPEVLAASRAAVAEGTRDLGFVRLGAGFAAAPSVSIDTAVMERTALAAVVPCDPGWSDVGNWSSLWDIAPKDAAGNATMGPAALLGARRCYVRSEGILTAEIDLDHLLGARLDFDPVGHYARPDLFSLRVDETPQLPVISVTASTKSDASV